jgi:ribosomal protein S21
MMGIRIRLHDGEPIGQALRRFKKLVRQHKPFGDPHNPTYWWYAPPFFIRNTEIRRYKEFKKRYKSRLATLAAKHAGKIR